MRFGLLVLLPCVASCASGAKHAWEPREELSYRMSPYFLLDADALRSEPDVDRALDRCEGELQRLESIFFAVGGMGFTIDRGRVHGQLLAAELCSRRCRESFRVRDLWRAARHLGAAARVCGDNRRHRWSDTEVLGLAIELSWLARSTLGRWCVPS